MIKKVYMVDVEANSRQNGIGTYLRTLIPILRWLGREVTLISLNSGVGAFTSGRRMGCVDYRFPTADYNACAEAYCESLSQNIVDSDDSAFWVNYTPCLTLVKELKRRFPKSRIISTVHDQGWTKSLLGKSELLRSILVDGRQPDIVSQRTFDFVRNYGAEERQLYEHCDAVVALSESAYATFVDIYGVDRSKVHMIRNCIDDVKSRRNVALCRKLRDKYGMGADEKMVLYAGRPVKVKGFEALLRAFAMLRSERSDVRLVVAGRLSDLARAEWLLRPIAPWTTCLGLIPHEEVKEWYGIADVGVLPSFTEQCSFSGLEMMANRLLVVASDGHCVRDMFVDGRNAVVAHIPDDPLDDDAYAAELCRALRQAIDMKPRKASKLLAEATRRVKTHYSPASFAAGYSQLLDSL